MTFSEAFHFLRPAWLLLLPIVVWLWWLRRQSMDSLRGWRSVMAPDLLSALTVGEDSKTNWQGAPLLVGWIVGVIALAGPTWRPETSPLADNPVPVMVVLKSNETTDLADLSPSRIERARLKIADLAGARKGQPMGLIAYAGTSHLVLPPTRDTSVVADLAAEISSAIMPKPGDDLAMALRLAATTLGDTGGSIIVIADTVGPENVAGLEAFRKEQRLPVHFLAIAREETPELDAIQAAASALAAEVTVMTADLNDVDLLVKNSATAPVAVADNKEGTRWAEAGWWLLPIIAILCLAEFRRVEDRQLSEATS